MCSKTKNLLKIKEISKNPNINDCAFLTKILEDSYDFEVLDSVALVLYEIICEGILDKLMSKILDPLLKNHRGTLLFSCSVYDCSNYVNELVQIVLEDNYESAIESYFLITENCVFITKENVQISIDKLKNITKRDYNNENIELINSLTTYFNKLIAL